MLSRSSIFCAGSSTDTPWSTSNRFVQKSGAFFFSPTLRKSLNIIEEYEGLCHWSIRVFVLRDSPRPLKIELAMSPSYPLPLVMGVSMIPNTVGGPI